MSSYNAAISFRAAWRYGATLALGLGLGVLVQRSFGPATAKPSTALGSNPNLAARATSEAPAPWGELETTHFALEFSDELLPHIQPFLTDPEWFFPGYSLEGVTNLFRSCRFREAALAPLLAKVEWEMTAPILPGRGSPPFALTDPTPNGVWVFPSSQVIFDLEPAVRERIYSILATSEHNPSYRFPFRFVPQDFDSLLLQSKLPPGTIQRIRGLAYTNENAVCLADVESLGHLLTPVELKSLLKVVYQAPTFVMRLRLSPGTDVAGLARYWGRGGRERVIRPFLQGLAKSPAQPAVSVSFMLPAFARTHLYTFPDPTRDPAALQRQGLWTALNFFNEQPDNRYLDDTFALQALRRGFEATRGAPTYGDLIVLTSPSGDIVHAGVFIAQDVVFTRNGPDKVQPWVLMRIPDMQEKFGAAEPLQPVVFHRKSA
jgi:hypothetical protein